MKAAAATRGRCEKCKQNSQFTTSATIYSRPIPLQRSYDREAAVQESGCAESAHLWFWWLNLPSKVNGVSSMLIILAMKREERRMAQWQNLIFQNVQSPEQGFCVLNHLHVLASTNRRALGLVNFVPALAYQFCLNLPAAFTQPGARLLLEACIRICRLGPGKNWPYSSKDLFSMEHKSLVQCKIRSSQISILTL